MSSVRILPHSAQALANRYDTAADTLDIAILELGPLVSESHSLLSWTPHPNANPINPIGETSNGLRRDSEDLAWRIEWIETHDNIPIPDGTINLVQLARTNADALARFRQHETQGLPLTQTGQVNSSELDEKDDEDDLGEGLWGKLSRWAENVTEEQVVLGATLLAIVLSDSGGQKEQEADQNQTQEGEPSFWDNVKNNVLSGDSVVRGVLTGQLSPEAVETIIENAPAVLRTANNAANQIQTLDPTSIQGARLIASDPGQFIDNQVNFFGGAKDATIELGKLAGAAAIASNPVLNDLYEQQTGTNAQQEIGDAVVAAAKFAAEDPDAFATAVIDWEGLEEDPIRWAGNKAPDIAIEVLSGGTITGAIGARRAANVVTDAADAARRGASGPRNIATHQQYLDELRNLERHGSPGPDGAVRAADEALENGARNGGAAQFDVDGHSFVDVSGSPTAIDPTVQRVLDDVPDSARKPWHERCAEPRCVSQALAAGVDPSQGTMNAVQIGSPANIPHGNLRPPCPSCVALRNAFGYAQ